MACSRVNCDMWGLALIAVFSALGKYGAVLIRHVCRRSGYKGHQNDCFEVAHVCKILPYKSSIVARMLQQKETPHAKTKKRSSTGARDSSSG